ncbi:MAG: hypothetical protein QOI10_3005 [Solirubrobacterales bacterium]|nr:hypothetical protein [Solirubrobacterales bacterium]
MGLEDGRYLGRDPERVLVVQVADPPPQARRRLGRAKPRDADPKAQAQRVPVTTLTAIRPDDLGEQSAAQAWLRELRDDREAVAGEIAEALLLVNLAVHAHRAATLDPQIPDIGAAAALAVRVGYGTGDELAESRYSEAIEVPRSERRRRAELLRPQERVAEVLGRRATVAACELLLIRARSDLDAGRSREVALQLRVGLEALLAERDALQAPDQDDDFAALSERRPITGEAANEALAAELSAARLAEVTETLRICERVLRRKRALG